MTRVIVFDAAKKEVSVTDWRLLQTYHPRWHVFGRFGPACKYWMTPPLVFEDVCSLAAESARGQRYRLVGAPGDSSMAASFIECCATFDARLATTLDVTAELLELQRRMLGKIDGWPIQDV